LNDDDHFLSLATASLHAPEEEMQG
jgi:hypothetical protein